MTDWRIAIGLALLISAGPVLSSETPETGSEPGAAQAEAEAPEVAGEATEGAGATEPAAEEPLSIMDTPLDGSSTEAFKAGLATLDEQATEEEYRSVMSALDYLLFYDLSVRRNRKNLYAKLDGYTPNQIIEEVRTRSASRRK